MIPLGVLDENGTLSATTSAPALPLGLDSAVLFVQLLALDVDEPELYIGTPLAITIVDASL